MSNTYAINTTRGKEFEVEDELTKLGLRPWVPKRLGSRYVKEKREAVWYDAPYIPKLAFCVIPAIYWTDVRNIKHIIGKPVPLSSRDIEGVPGYTCKATGKPVPAVYGLRDFREAVEAEHDDMERRKKNSQYQCMYAPGQALEILDGPFIGFPAEFQRAVNAAHDHYAKLRVSIQIFGRETEVEIEPDKVRHV